MNKIPTVLREKMAMDPFYGRCMRRHEGTCSGRITWEHAFIYAGRQIQEQWAIIPLCEYHHLGPGMVKWMNELFALRRATLEDLAKYPRRNWVQHLQALEYKYSKCTQ
jgi:hypothetical protein